MKKNYIYIIFFFLLVVSCNRDTASRDIRDSFNQLVKSLEESNSENINTLVPFLENEGADERELFLDSFRKLIDTDYKLIITRKSDELYYVKVEVEDSDTLWSGIILPYKMDEDGKWRMIPVLKVIKTYDIVPAGNN